MKKVIISLGVLAVVCALFLATVATFHSIKGDNVRAYTRFSKINENGEKVINWNGLHSPLAVEYQKVVYDTVELRDTVMYPIAHKFYLGEVGNDTAKMALGEKVVARKIADSIAHAIDAINLRLNYDYDGQASAVRMAASPSLPALQKPKVIISTEGTASPEAAKYGLKQSLMPGAYEAENRQLAGDRLVRTNLFLYGELVERGIDSVKIIDTLSKELQLNSVDQVSMALKNPAILDTMRRVVAYTRIPTERLEVTPVTVPILFLLWPALALWLLSLLSPFAKREESRPEYKFAERVAIVREEESFDWGWLWNLLLRIIGFIAGIIVGTIIVYMLIQFLPWWIVPLITLAYLLYSLRRQVWSILRVIGWGIRIFFVIILLIFDALLDWLQSIPTQWKRLCTCRKVLIIHLIIDAFIVISIIAGWIVICHWFFW